MLPLVEHMVKQGNYRIQFATANDVKHFADQAGAEFVDTGSVPGGSKQSLYLLLTCVVLKENMESAKAFNPTLSPLETLAAHNRNFQFRGEIMLDNLLGAFQVQKTTSF